MVGSMAYSRLRSREGVKMGSFASAALAVTMIAAMMLLIFGLRFALRPEDRQRGLLMIACGIIFIGNVLIWTL
jgi:fumarate reductase subunit D